MSTHEEQNTVIRKFESGSRFRYPDSSQFESGSRFRYPILCGSNGYIPANNRRR